MIKLFQLWFINRGIDTDLASFLSSGLAVVLILVLSLTAYFLTKKIILGILARYIKRFRFKWGQILLENKVFTRLSHFTPAIIIFAFAGTFPEYQSIIQRLSIAYMIMMGTFAAEALLNAAEDIYQTFEVARLKPIRGIIQVVKIFLFALGGIWFIATIIDRSPILLLSGIGALTAVIMLVFKDSLLGLAGGIQLTANDMVRLGDWIEMPKYGADGDVIDITLITVKVKNFDNTITTIPTYALISDSFKNWRGMQESGGRRIKRSVYIDSSSIRFCTEEMLERYARIEYISDYINKKKLEIEAHNQKHQIDPSHPVNGRGLTNIGTFRAYLQAYLKNHPAIHKGMIQMVRQLPPAQHGLPIEIYAFTSDTAWTNYEAIQADIFDHILAVIPHFDLRIHQNPTGYDLHNLRQLPLNDHEEKS